MGHEIKTYHRYLDEAGDTTFYGSGKLPVIGQQGISLSFILGMVKFKEPIEPLRKKIIELKNQVILDPYFKDIPSIQKKIKNDGYYFHATDDVPEVRKLFYDFINSIDCSFECVIARKNPLIYEKKHHGKEQEFYADMISHLLKNKLSLGNKLILNIAQRGKSTRNANLAIALTKAVSRFHEKKKTDKSVETNVVFNVQNHLSEPLLNVADYFCWSVQRVFERGEVRYYNYLQEKIKLAADIYDYTNYEGSRNFYTPKNPLSSSNKISLPIH